MITSVFSQFPAFAYKHARPGAGPGPSLAKRSLSPGEPPGWLRHSAGTAPLPPSAPAWAVGSGITPGRAQSQPWALPRRLGPAACGAQVPNRSTSRSGWARKLSTPFTEPSNLRRKASSQPERVLAGIGKGWGCAHHCAFRDALWFCSRYAGRNIVWDPSKANPWLDLQAPHTSEITGKIKNMKNNNKGRAAR